MKALLTILTTIMMMNDSFLALHRGRTIYNNVTAVIVPHAGYYFSGVLAAVVLSFKEREIPYERIGKFPTPNRYIPLDMPLKMPYFAS